MNALIILFYRIVTLFTRVPVKSKALQTSVRSEKLAKSNCVSLAFINIQSDLLTIPYGKGDLGINGCGPIALFNALKALNNSDSLQGLSFSSIVDYLEIRGAAFGGRLGTAPHIINRYLKILGYETGTIMDKSENKLNAFSGEFDAFISLIFNDSKSIKKGLHYICTVKNGYGGFTSHNPERTGQTLFNTLNLCSKDEIRHVYTIGIKRRDAIS